MKGRTTKTFQPTIPTWMYEMLSTTVKELGRGPRPKGGSQSIGMLAFSFLLSIEPAERMQLLSYVPPATAPEGACKQMLAGLWINEWTYIISRIPPEKRAAILRELAAEHGVELPEANTTKPSAFALARPFTVSPPEEQKP